MGLGFGFGFGFWLGLTFTLTLTLPLARLTLGRHMEVICLPVQSGRGLRMAGTGSAPEKESRCITRFITMSRSRKVSRLA